MDLFVLQLDIPFQGLLFRIQYFRLHESLLQLDILLMDIGFRCLQPLVFGDKLVSAISPCLLLLLR